MNQIVTLCGTSRIANNEFRQMLDGANAQFSIVTPDTVAARDDEKVSSGCLLIGESINADEVIQILSQLIQTESCLVPVIVAENPAISFVVHVMRLGALNVIAASESAESLMEAVEEAFNLSAEQLSNRVRHKKIVSRIDKLSARQKEVMAYVVDGASNKTIAAELHLSPKTIEVHRASVMRKMQAKSLPDLVKFSLTQFAKPHSAVALTPPIPGALPTTNALSQ